MDTQGYEVKWSTAKPGSKQDLALTLAAFAIEDRIIEFLAGKKISPSLPPAALAAATHAAFESGRRYYEAKVPRRAIVCKMSARDLRLVAQTVEQFPTAPAETEQVLDMLAPLPTDLAWIVSANVLRQLYCWYGQQSLH